MQHQLSKTFVPQAYLDNYKFEHHVICGAVDEPSNVAFSMHQDKVQKRLCVSVSLLCSVALRLYQATSQWADLAFGSKLCSMDTLRMLCRPTHWAVCMQNVQPKMTAHPGQHLKQEAKPSDTIGCALLARMQTQPSSMLIVDLHPSDCNSLLQIQCACSQCQGVSATCTCDLQTALVALTITWHMLCCSIRRDGEFWTLCRIFHLRFNEKELVQEIYFLRQLSHDEAARKASFYSTLSCTVCWLLCFSSLPIAMSAA